VRSNLLLMIVFGVSVLATGCGASDGDDGRRTSVESDPSTTSTERGPTPTTLDPGTTATGSVFTVQGTPIPGALVDPSPLDGQEWPGYESLRTTDASGRYQLPLPAGRWDVAVSADGYTPTTVRITIPTTGLVETDVTLERV
jgi:hypothetical protein